MSNFLEHLKHIAIEKWEVLYLGLVVILGATAGFLARLKLNADHFKLTNWLSDILLGTFTGWAGFCFANELNLSTNMTAIAVGFSAALGLKAFQLATFIFEKKVEEKLGFNLKENEIKDKKNDKKNK